MNTLMRTLTVLALTSLLYSGNAVAGPSFNTDEPLAPANGGEASSPSFNKLLERALPEKERNAANIQKMRSFFIPYYDQHNTLFSRPYDGIMQVLVQLQKQGVLLAIASNKYQKATEKLVRHYFPQITFAVIVGQRDGIAVKPDPFCIREILEITHTDPQEVLYVGDSDVDVQTARRAQVCMCAVTWGFRSREELIACNPTYIADRAEEILDYV